MAHYFFKKFLFLLLTLFCITTLTFFLMKALPGGPFSHEQAVPPEILKALQKHYGLDQPLHVQYKEYLLSVLQGNLGPSLKYKGYNVNQIIRSSFPTSLQLGLQALLLAISGGIILGIVAALTHTQWQDWFVLAIVTIGLSVPTFVAATLLQHMLAVAWPCFPVARWGTFSQTILPSISLAILPLAFIARLTRNSLLEVLRQGYIKTAYAKGIAMPRLIVYHLLRNALLPLLSYLSPLCVNVMVGSFVIEKIFGIPGLGQWMVLSIMNRDYSVILGITLFYSSLLLLSIFFVDVLSIWLDPRLRQTVTTRSTRQ